MYEDAEARDQPSIKRAGDYSCFEEKSTPWMEAWMEAVTQGVRGAAITTPLGK